MSEAVVVNNNADLVTTKELTSADATPDEGDTVVFTITVSNNGAAQATNVDLTDTWPSGLTFVSAVASQGTYTSGTGLWDIGTLNNGASVTLVLTGTVKVGEGGNTLTNSVSAATSDQTDPSTTGDDLSEQLAVNLPPPPPEPEPPAPPAPEPVIDSAPPVPSGELPTLPVEIIDPPKPEAPVEQPAPPVEFELRVQRDIPLQRFEPTSGPALVTFTIPADTFAHTDAQAKISLSATMVDGSPLPHWLVFDPAKGEFRGIAPEEFDGVIEVRVIARDDKGSQVETMVRIQVRAKAGFGGGRAGLSDQFRSHGVFAWKAERDQLLRHAREAGLKAKAAKAA